MASFDDAADQATDTVADGPDGPDGLTLNATVETWAGSRPQIQNHDDGPAQMVRLP